ncbi:MarR family transcriptional regulator [Sphingomonas leidyi]|uniref:MarR family transcriptional regulator n=1 Tax=Sphingomonas leidyi TaxID=68569 RepID=UPI0026A1965C
MTNSVSIGDGSLLDLARQLQRMRAKAAKLFPRDVFRDSAWDMVLELFIAGQQQRVVCVKELIFVSGETSTSALRRIDRLEAAELLHRSHDPDDHRRMAVTLTDKGDAAMRAMLHSLFPGDSSSITEKRAHGADRPAHELHSSSASLF